MQRRTGSILFALGMAASFIVHWPTLHYGFVYDDYAFVRPHSLAEVLSSFAGPWDPRGPNVAFFRPLSVALHAIDFEAFQFDPRLYHAASLVLFGVALGVLGLTVYHIADSMMVAALAIALTAVHPHMPYAATAWITNQMHLWQLLVFACSLRWWWSCRERPWAWWTPLLVLQVVAFLIKEDGVMLAPSIIAAHLLWTWTVRGRPALPPWPYVGLAMALGAGGIWWRQVALGGVGGYRTPGWNLAMSNFWRGYSRTLACLPVDRPGKLLVTSFVVGASVLGGLAALRARGRVLFLSALGLTLVTLCNLPYVFVTKREQWHLLSLGGAVLLTGATWALWRACRVRTLRAVLAACTLSAILSMAWVSRQMSADFAPFSPYVLETDRIVTQWAIVAPEIQAFLNQKRAVEGTERDRMVLPDALQTVSYGIHGSESDAIETGWRWTSRHVTLFVHPRARALQMIIGAVALPSMPQGPGSVAVTVDGTSSRQVPLVLGTWTTLDVPLPSRPIARRLHRVDLSFAEAVVPAEVDPASKDTRELAARLGRVAIVW